MPTDPTPNRKQRRFHNKRSKPGSKERKRIADADPELVDAKYLECRESGIECPVVVVADLRDKVGRLFSAQHLERAEALVADAAAAGTTPCVFRGMPKAAVIDLLAGTSPETAKFLRETDLSQFFPVVSIADGGTQVGLRPIPPASKGTHS